MERLRCVTRAGDVPVVPLVRESAAALIALADNPGDLLTSCRRLLDRRPGCAPLAWLAARMLTGSDPRSEARDAVAEIEADPTGDELDHGLGHGLTVLMLGRPDIAGPVLSSRPDLRVLPADEADSAASAGLGVDLVVLESGCLGPGAALAPPGSAAAAARARAASAPVWLVAGVGRVLPEPMWGLLAPRLGGGEPWDCGFEVVEFDGLVDRVVTPAGMRTPAQLRRRIDCPAAPELFRTR